MLLFLSFFLMGDGRPVGSSSSFPPSSSVHFVPPGRARRCAHPPTHDSRVLQSANTCAGLKIFDDSLATCNAVINYEVKPPFVQGSDEAGMECLSLARSIVLHPSGETFFYILDQMCSTDKGMTEPIRRRLSFYESILSTQTQVAEGRLISTSWPGSDGAGAQLLNFTCDDKNCTRNMDVVTGMVISRSGSELILSGHYLSIPPRSWLSALSTENGGRVSTPLIMSFPGGMAIDPSMTSLFFTNDQVPPRRIWSCPVSLNENGEMSKEGPSTFTPLPVFMFDLFHEWDTSSLYLGPYSFPRDGRCLYFVDRNPGGSVWALDRSSNVVNLVAGRGLPPPYSPHITSSSNQSSGNGSKIVMSNALNVSFGVLYDLAVTEDGLIIFVSEKDTGLVKLIELDAPCGGGRRVIEVSEYLLRPGAGVYGLAVGGNNSGLLVLLLGSDDGHVFQLSINRSALQSNNLGPGSPHPNPDITSTSSPSPSRSSSPPHNDGQAMAIGPIATVVISVVPVVLAMVAFFLVFLYRVQVARACCMRRFVPVPGLTKYPLDTIKVVTNNFDQSRQVGQPGGFGSVYRGLLPNNDPSRRGRDVAVAVKVMRQPWTQAKESMFQAEMTILGPLHHVNVCNLIGFCADEGHRILVYEYKEGGSLNDRLFSRLDDRPREEREDGGGGGGGGEEAVHNLRSQLTLIERGGGGGGGGGEEAVQNRRSPLTLIERVVVAQQIAEALRYLHHLADPPVIHRDLKSQNVLLGGGRGREIKASLADFGLARFLEAKFLTSAPTVIQEVAGTDGWFAPEYARRGKLSRKIDVYCFGVLALEMLTGRRAAVRGHGKGQTRYLVADEGKHLTNVDKIDMKEFVDPSIRAEMDDPVMRELARGMMRVAADCLIEEEKERPKIQRTAAVIESLLEQTR
ncbi:hypothetical protein CBR_g38751 [Chara braunii]|uniref:Protein kinase domain-containing protein n=1 Tax=Chara braunii TaxID=69332 RepID=A0A388LQ75_CHABU|nr:hypothetical protein CBR_g38751 [Chara braunii]|eukprot:GBG84467.1 hypothetical protein CBR_g38751 [Chara braunii]